MPWRRRRRDWDDLFDEVFGREFEYFDEIAEKMFKDIDISSSETSVDIKAEGATRRYSESVDLGCEVIPDSAKARYNNGVLEIVFKRKEPKKEERKKVDIE